MPRNRLLRGSLDREAIPPPHRRDLAWGWELALPGRIEMRDLHTIDRAELEELVSAMLDALCSSEAADGSLQPREFRPPAGVGVSITLDDQARPIATVTFEHMVVTLHESLVTPGALNIEVDTEGAAVIVHVNDAEIFRCEECAPEDLLENA